MIELLIKIYIVAFFLNLLYELLHSLLYKTCIEASLKKYVYLMLKAAAFDGLSIAIIYFLVSVGLATENPFNSYLSVLLFSIICLLFAWAWEVHAIKHHRWEYSDKMPRIFEVGLTPLLQLMLTGMLSLWVVFY